MTPHRDYIFILPTLKISGGNLEAIRLAKEIHDRGKSVAIISMWRTPNPIETNRIESFILFNFSVNRARALLSLPILILNFINLSGKIISPKSRIVFTHYATYLLCFAIYRFQRWFFVQALEWKFVQNRFFSYALRRFIMNAYSKGKVITANQFLSKSLTENFITVTGTADIWADAFFYNHDKVERDIDIVLMFRKGIPKRSDWGKSLLSYLRDHSPLLRIVIISPDEEFSILSSFNSIFLLRPSREEMREVYRRSRVFILFSDHEGFGLPPLEAMGSGCVPLCRDAGGIRAYMEPALEANILPLTAPPEAMAIRLETLLKDHAEWSRLSKISQEVFYQGLERAADRISGLVCCGLIDEQVEA